MSLRQKGPGAPDACPWGCCQTLAPASGAGHPPQCPLPSCGHVAPLNTLPSPLPGRVRAWLQVPPAPAASARATRALPPQVTHLLAPVSHPHTPQGHVSVPTCRAPSCAPWGPSFRWPLYLQDRPCHCHMARPSSWGLSDLETEAVVRLELAPWWVRFSRQEPAAAPSQSQAGAAETVPGCGGHVVARVRAWQLGELGAPSRSSSAELRGSSLPAAREAVLLQPPLRRPAVGLGGHALWLRLLLPSGAHRPDGSHPLLSQGRELCRGQEGRSEGHCEVSRRPAARRTCWGPPSAQGLTLAF